MSKNGLIVTRHSLAGESFRIGWPGMPFITSWNHSSKAESSCANRAPLTACAGSTPGTSVTLSKLFICVNPLFHRGYHGPLSNALQCPAIPALVYLWGELLKWSQQYHDTGPCSY